MCPSIKRGGAEGLCCLSQSLLVDRQRPYFVCQLFAHTAIDIDIDTSMDVDIDMDTHIDIELETDIRSCSWWIVLLWGIALERTRPGPSALGLRMEALGLVGLASFQCHWLLGNARCLNARIYCI